jgi:hypothetical protein
MPNVRLTACPLMCICPVRHERQRNEGKDCQLRFYDDFSPLVPLPAQVRVRETEAWDLPVMTMTLESRPKNSGIRHHDVVIIEWLRWRRAKALALKHYKTGRMLSQSARPGGSILVSIFKLME